MLSSKFFSLLTFAAAAVAQGFPKDPFFIVNTESELVFEAEYRSSDSEVLIALSERDANNGAQIWTYTEGRGFLKNQASGLVLEVPRTDGRVDYGTRLQVTAPRNETNDDLTQLWDYDAGAQHLFTLASESACVAWNSSFVGYWRRGCSEPFNLFICYRIAEVKLRSRGAGLKDFSQIYCGVGTPKAVALEDGVLARIAVAPGAGDFERNQFPVHQVETKDERAREAGGEVTVSSRGLGVDGFGDFEHVHERRSEDNDLTVHDHEAGTATTIFATDDRNNHD
ncbi:hypothetical protein AGABI1DRAFT_95122 [Agaricus bisporus var. burnettii JB137-S8]|uniref:Ricin B lectin domain-containing protein n=1 Tax=Agaricus bisporus var. burnettii (strain JB137-S8 / ATCC MYA-4627 / FGSC 10392) TaxID=597362 RepID=K5XL04_AGABU|nr:uncharacterized protein AGABI1DRAFT_95122 [Agaricus bisporus var. burnettii JB137-S8]EKM75185.1 hypothetical protein AGABI1DRAFT_95122 [Agaricus bisporus var. burnettii JB137-S8]